MVDHRNPPGMKVEVAWDTPVLTRPDPEDWTRIDQGVMDDPFVFWGGELAEWGGVPIQWGEGDQIDVAPCLRRLDTEIGVRMKTSESEPGTAVAVWGDHYGVLNRANPSGPFADGIKKRRRIQFTAEPEDDDPEVVATMFLDSVSPNWEVGDSTVDMQCVDLLAVLAEETLPPSVLHVEIMAMESIVGYWPMTESAGTFADDVKGTSDGVYKTPVTTTGQLVPFDDRQCVQIQATSPGDPNGQSMVAPIVGNADGMTIGCWFKWEQTLPRERMIVLILSHTSPTTTGVALQIDPELDGGEPTGKARLRWLAQVAGEGSFYAESEDLLDLFTAEPHLLAFSVAKNAYDFDVVFGGGIAMYFDGAGINYISNRDAIGTMTEDSFGEALDGMVQLFAGFRSSDGTLDQSDAPVATIGHVFYGSGVEAEGTIDDIYIAGTNPWASDLTGVRLNKVLDLVGVDPDDRNITTGTQLCGPTLLGAQSVPDYIRKIGQTEASPIFVDRLGRITMLPALPNDPPATFTLDGREPGPDDDWYPYAEIVPADSRDRLINTVAITRESGTTLERENAQSVDDYGRAPVSLDSLVASPDEARELADGIISRNKTPQVIAESIDLATRRKDIPSDWALTLGPGDVGDVGSKPAKFSTRVTQRSVVERVSHAFDWQGWDHRVDLGLAPHLVLPCFALDDPDAGLDDAVICEGEP